MKIKTHTYHAKRYRFSFSFVSNKVESPTFSCICTCVCAHQVSLSANKPSARTRLSSELIPSVRTLPRRDLFGPKRRKTFPFCTSVIFFAPEMRVRIRIHRLYACTPCRPICKSCSNSHGHSDRKHYLFIFPIL